MCAALDATLAHFADDANKKRDAFVLSTRVISPLLRVRVTLKNAVFLLIIRTGIHYKNEFLLIKTLAKKHISQAAQKS